jgi:mono/diheme cytochrome c family protein
VKRCVVLLAALLFACQQREQAVTKTVAAPAEEVKSVAMGAPGTLVPGNGSTLISTHCIACHSVDIVRQQRLTQKQWTATIEKMSKWGSTLPESDRPAAIEYLSRNYGPSNRFVPFETEPAPVDANPMLAGH